MIIDFHTHNFPDAIAPRAIASMVEMLRHQFVPFGDGTLACQLADAKANGIDRCVMCPIATKPSQADVILRSALEIRDGARGEEAARVIMPLASVHPADPDFKVHLKAIADSGIPGIKLHPYYQGFRLDDPSVFPFFAAVRDLGLFVIAHCGYDHGFLNVPMCCGPVEIAALLAAVPGLGPRFVAAHLGGREGNPPGATDMLLDTGCLIDTACLEMLQDNPDAIRVMETWPAERIVFGTDYPWNRQRRLVEWVMAHRPDPSEQERIFHLNAERMLGL
ncbi:MAG: amidohydrolase [Kiritimatiellae bacterium]|nr:amidohydrolase [Kiritimatiellia bacterium]